MDKGVGVHFVSVRFRHFKGLTQFHLPLGSFNVLVGPNNAGKSTIIGAFRMLSEGIRKANTRNPDLVEINGIDSWAYRVRLDDLPIATENVFSDYDDTKPASIEFSLSNGNTLKLIFVAIGECYLVCDSKGPVVRRPADFRHQFNVSVGFVPVLGPVEHHEPLYKAEAARLALLTHGASRNFRNIWYHFPEGFDEFRNLVQQTWPGMDVQLPEVEAGEQKPRLYMFCPENRIDREIFWAGFGFQVWCQMLTYVLQAKNDSLLIIDEPDIYLHSDLQRQLIAILKEVGPDILIATHSTEMIAEVDPSDLLVINKRSKSAQRVKDSIQLQSLFTALGSSLNPILTQLAKTKRAVFVEGKEFKIYADFARKLDRPAVANRTEFAVVPIDGFNPERAKNMAAGMELALGLSLKFGIVLDRDYRCEDEIKEIQSELQGAFEFAVIHDCKEVENFLLAPQSIQRAIEKRIAEIKRRGGTDIILTESVEEMLMSVSEPLKHDTLAQYLSKLSEYEKKKHRHHDSATVNAKLMKQFDSLWKDLTERMKLVPGKEMVSLLNAYLQDKYKFSLTHKAIVSAFDLASISPQMKDLVETMDSFASQREDAL